MLGKASTFNSGGHFVHQSGTVCAILVEGFMKNITVKLLQIELGPVVQEMPF